MPQSHTIVSATLPDILENVRKADYIKAEKTLYSFLKKKFPALSLDEHSICIRKDPISLNSVNGFFNDTAGERYFFKFHLEEDEADTLSEYYQSTRLANAGYPTETPLLASHEVGEQILIYPYVQHERLFDACDRNEQANTEEAVCIIEAQKRLDTLCAKKCKETLHLATQKEYQSEPLLQLFFWRLAKKIKEDEYQPNEGRHKRFYLNQSFSFPNNLTVSYEKLKDLKWVINGLAYEHTLAEAFNNAFHLLSPKVITEYPACTAHGDAHNGNVWYKPTSNAFAELSYFDPAFAGAHIPALLAEVKATFHNIFAHPLWLYSPEHADKQLDVHAFIEQGHIHVTHHWSLSPLRQAFLESKCQNFWQPTIELIHKKGWLPSFWEEYIRSALFCCPTLVMNLRAYAGTKQNSHTPKTSLLGFAIAMMCASKPQQGNDIISDFFNILHHSINMRKDNEN